MDSRDADVPIRVADAASPEGPISAASPHRGSAARAQPPIGGQPGGSSIGVEIADVLGEHARLSAIGGIDLDPEPMRTPGAPLRFMLRDPDDQEGRRAGSCIISTSSEVPGAPAAAVAPPRAAGLDGLAAELQTLACRPR